MLKIKMRKLNLDLFEVYYYIYIYFIKNKNLIVSWYYNTILWYNTADKKMILPSIPILKTLVVPAWEWRVTSSLQYFTSSCHILQNQITLLQLTICSIYRKIKSCYFNLPYVVSIIFLLFLYSAQEFNHHHTTNAKDRSWELEGLCYIFLSNHK
jgi:hypothetical protein